MSFKKLSTSALGRELDLSSQQLFKVLTEFGWIKRDGDNWVLTAKGEFEGGEYIHSKRYGRYIAWPESTIEHPLIKSISDQRTVSASQLAKRYSLTAREVNRLLAELGWINHSIQGWELTAQGKQQGGIQLENQNSGNFYVVWPDGIETNSVLSEQLDWMHKIEQHCHQPKDDLFSQPEDLICLDGHIHHSVAHLKICYWLYLAGLAHACPRKLPGQSDLFADFYLPIQQIYIEYWGESETPSQLSQQLRRREYYQQNALKVIELEAEDLPLLDEVLTRELRRQGVRVF